MADISRDFIEDLVVTPEQMTQLNNFIEALKRAASLSLNTKEAEKNLKDFAKSLGMSEDKLKDFIKSVKDVDSAFKKYKEALESIRSQSKKSAEAQNELHKTVEDTLISYGRMSGNIDKAIKAIRKEAEEKGRNSQLTDRSRESIIKELNAIKESIKKTKEARIEEKRHALAKEKIAKESRTYSEKIKDNIKALHKMQSAMRAAGAEFNKFLGAFGAQTFSIGNAMNSVLEYNQSLYDLERTYKVFGVGNKNMADTMRYVSKETSFSKKEFVDFAQSVASGYVGMTPTVQQIAQFAKILQTQFGPNVKVAKEVAQDLLGVFESYPPALDAMMEVSKVMEEIRTGDKDEAAGARERLKVLRTSLAVAGEYGNMSAQQRERLLKYTTETNQKEQDLLQTNKSVAKVQQQSADAVLKMGQALEPHIKTIAEGMSKVLEYMNSLPEKVFLVVGAFQALTTLMGTGIASQIGKVPKRFEIWLDSLEKIRDKTEDVSDAIGRAGEGVASAGRGRGGAGRAASAVASATRSRADAFEESARRWTDTIEQGANRRIRGDQIANRGRRIADRRNSEYVRSALRRGGQEAGAGMRAGSAGGAGSQMMAGMKMAIPMAVIGAVMSGMGEYSRSRSAGFDKGDSLRRSAVSGVGAGGGAIVGGLLGSLAGPAGTMIGATIGGIVGQKISEAINREELEKKKNEEADQRSRKKFRTGSLTGIKDESDTLGEMLKRWERIKKTHEANLKLLASQRDVIYSQIDALNEMFVMTSKQASEAYSEAFQVILKETEEAQRYLDEVLGARREIMIGLGVDKNRLGTLDEAVSAIEDRIRQLGEEGIQLELDVQAAKQINDLDAVKKKMDELNANELMRRSLTTEVLKIAEQQKTVIDNQKTAADAVSKVIRGAVDEHLKMNSVLESRLDTERTLMENAQFGMGASIQMMQKQVNLSYDNIKAIQEQIQLQDQRVAIEVSDEKIMKGLTKEERERAKMIMLSTFNAAKNQDTTEGIQAALGQGLATLKEMGVTDNKRRMIHGILNKQIGDFNDLQQKSLSAQNKIYELTKDIREGYLDALREMSFGAGEFEAIIGTQEMGVTQLMDSVKGVTGIDFLNTMALGGYTIQGSEASKARMAAPSKYTIGGFQAGAFAGAQVDDIFGYGRSAQAFQQHMMGKGAAPTAGYIGDNREHENTKGAILEQNINKQGFMESEFSRALHTWSGGGNNLQSVKIDVRTGEGGKGAPGQERRTRRGANTVTAFAGAVAGGSRGTTPEATNVFAPSAAPGPMGIPPVMLRQMQKDPKMQGLLKYSQEISNKMTELNDSGRNDSKTLKSLQKEQVKVSKAIVRRQRDIAKGFSGASQTLSDGSMHWGVDVKQFLSWGGHRGPMEGAPAPATGPTRKPAAKPVTGGATPKGGTATATSEIKKLSREQEYIMSTQIESWNQLDARMNEFKGVEAQAIASLAMNIQSSMKNAEENSYEMMGLEYSMGTAIKELRKRDSRMAETIQSQIVKEEMNHLDNLIKEGNLNAYTISKSTERLAKSLGMTEDEIIKKVHAVSENATELMKAHKEVAVSMSSGSKKQEDMSKAIRMGEALSIKRGSLVGTAQERMHVLLQKGEGQDKRSAIAAQAEYVFEELMKEEVFRSKSLKEQEAEFRDIMASVMGYTDDKEAIAHGKAKVSKIIRKNRQDRAEKRKKASAEAIRREEEYMDKVDAEYRKRKGIPEPGSQQSRRVKKEPAKQAQGPQFKKGIEWEDFLTKAEKGKLSRSKGIRLATARQMGKEAIPEEVKKNVLPKSTKATRPSSKAPTPTPTPTPVLDRYASVPEDIGTVDLTGPIEKMGVPKIPTASIGQKVMSDEEAREIARKGLAKSRAGRDTRPAGEGVNYLSMPKVNKKLPATPYSQNITRMKELQSKALDRDATSAERAAARSELEKLKGADKSALKWGSTALGGHVRYDPDRQAEAEAEAARVKEREKAYADARANAPESTGGRVPTALGGNQGIIVHRGGKAKPQTPRAVGKGKGGVVRSDIVSDAATQAEYRRSSGREMAGLDGGPSESGGKEVLGELKITLSDKIDAEMTKNSRLRMSFEKMA